MPSKSLKKEALLPQLLEIFRTIGYEAASLSKISELTGLGKASLYHHFPNGKQQMIEEVLVFVENWMHENVFFVLRSEDKPENKLEKMCNALNGLYNGGKSACLIGALTYSEILNQNLSKLKNTLEIWQKDLEAVFIEAGKTKEESKDLAEEVLVKVQGSLVISKAQNKKAVFTRQLQKIRDLVA
ncbi:MAG: TetR/AcrR family transcriptional regulator [Candidatus Caenarcaniphilales bacterium]|nr:TetR/AcrR family transcriptional regulator [Candidatus Caenarcaniphilales bacterium]